MNEGCYLERLHFLLYWFWDSRGMEEVLRVVYGWSEGCGEFNSGHVAAICTMKKKENSSQLQRCRRWMGT